MKLFAIKDETDPSASTLALLSCYEAGQEFYIDMPEGTDPWSVPLILSSFAKRERWVIGPDWSRRWVESRIVPAGRQNLGEILRVNGLESYDALSLLEMTEGRNSQDDCYVTPIGRDEAPSWFSKRESRRVKEVIALGGLRLLVAFVSEEVRMYGMGDLADAQPSSVPVPREGELFSRVKVSPGGRGVQWGTVARVLSDDLLRCGAPVALTWDDLARVASELLVDTAEASRMLGCSRQNISQLVKRGSLEPAKTSGKATLFFRSDIRARACDGPTPTEGR